jgi:DNA-binding Lrp family transcriptional regulator
MSDVDRRRLLEILECEGPVPADELATRLGCSAAEVDAAIEQARGDGLLLRYGALVNWEGLDDARIYAFIEVEATPEHGTGFDRLADYIGRFDEVHSLYLMSGRADLIVVVQGEDFREIARFVAEKLAPTPGVRSTATSFVLKTYKMEGERLGDEPSSRRLAVSP